MDSQASSSSSNANSERADRDPELGTNKNQNPRVQLDSQQTLTRNRVNAHAQESMKDTGKATKREVWQYYTKIDYTSARCNTCMKSIKHRGNTTNMMQHLRHSHRMHVPSTKKRTSQTASQSANPFKRAKYTEGNDSSEDVDDPPPKVQHLPKIQTQAKSDKSEKIDKAFQRMSSFQGGGSSATKITNAILFMIAAEQLSFIDGGKQRIQSAHEDNGPALQRS